MADLTARLLSDDFEKALQAVERNCDRNASISPITARILVDAIRELHARLRTAKAEGAAEALEKICMDVRCGGHAYSAKIYLDDGTYYKLGVVDASVIFAHAAAIRKSIEAKEGK